DTTLSSTLREALEAKGFAVDETTDGKGSVEQIHRDRPDLVLLAVDLSAGQNGYLICGKLKKDDELKATPVIIVGNPDGFGQHKKLKTRADEYVSKPVDMDELVNRVGGLIGFPEVAEAAVVEDESLGLGELVDEEPTNVGGPALTLPPEETVAGDPELDALDAAFDDLHEPPPEAEVEAAPAGDGEDEGESLAMIEEAEEPVSVEEVPDEPVVAEDEPHGDASLSALDDLGTSSGEDEAIAPEWNEPAVETRPQPPAAPEPPPPLPSRAAIPLRPAGAPLGMSRTPTAPGPASPTASEAAELRTLRAKVAELQGALDETNSRLSDSESRIVELQAEVDAKTAEAEAARSTGTKTDKEVFALKEASNRKDKEIVRLKSELNEKDQEIVEIRDREMALEQKISESSGETTRKDAQIKTLTTKTEQMAADRRRVDGELKAAKEEARSANAKLGTLQQDLDATTAQLDQLRTQLEGEIQQARDEAAKAQDEAAQVRTELEEVRAAADAARSESDDLRGQNAQLQGDVEAARAMVATQQQQFEDEAAGLRKRIAELEEQAQRHDERATKLYARIKGDEKMRDKTKKALSIAMQLLEEPQAEVGTEEDEVSAA
ncbi:MAG TPA: response regulator, partial [Myxococcales bacterium]|nr:response regulator [Myxococcales bacterium]